MRSKGKNPYSLLFGKEPKQLISRSTAEAEVVETFCDDEPSQQIFMITGVRGSGKTVLMTEISKKIEQRGDWIIVELNPENDLLESLAAKLSGENNLAQLFKKAKINLSFLGFGVEIEGVAPIRDIESALQKMLESIKKQKKRLLITIDEAVNTKSMRAFAGAYQIVVRKDLPVYLLMTGLYENIDDLQNEKHLTFLHRAPKLELKSLNIRSIADNYKKVLKISDEKALYMAKWTCGYSFAFQVLGYFTWAYRDDPGRIHAEYKQYLEEYVYEKIWQELSGEDRRVCLAIANVPGGSVADILERLEMTSNQFTPYRTRLIRKGIVNGDTYGMVRFTLPLFDAFVIENGFQV